MFANLNRKFKESFFSIFPVVIIVLAIALFFVDVPGPLLVKFSISLVLLFVGMSLFSLGADTAMIPVGHSIASGLTKTKKIWLLLLACFVMGLIITVAEPDISALANQIPSMNKWLFILVVGIGVGICFMLGIIRIFFKVRFRTIIAIGYAICFLFLIFVPKSFWALAFDASGVTTGAISVPFIMSFGLGISAMRSSKAEEAEGFGLAAICSIGPILSVLILGLFVGNISVSPVYGGGTTTWASIPQDFMASMGGSFVDSALLLLPILAIFLIFQFSLIKLSKTQIFKILVGLLFAYLGISLFLTGVNAGFSELGTLIGDELAGGQFSMLTYPIAFLLGYVIVLAEPAILVFVEQVSKFSSNKLSKRAIRVSMCFGVAISLFIAILRARFEINVLYFVLPIFGLSILLSFYNDALFNAISFDSGGVSSGIMSATFLLPFVEGVALAFGSDPMIGAFGTIALIASVPILIVQILGAITKFSASKYFEKLKKSRKKIRVLEFDY